MGTGHWGRQLKEASARQGVRRRLAAGNRMALAALCFVSLCWRAEKPREGGKFAGAKSLTEIDTS